MRSSVANSAESSGEFANLTPCSALMTTMSVLTNPTSRFTPPMSSPRVWTRLTRCLTALMSFSTSVFIVGFLLTTLSNSRIDSFIGTTTSAWRVNRSSVTLMRSSAIKAVDPHKVGAVNLSPMSSGAPIVAFKV